MTARERFQAANEQLWTLPPGHPDATLWTRAAACAMLAVEREESTGRQAELAAQAAETRHG